MSGQDVIQALRQTPANAPVGTRLAILFQFLSLKEAHFQNLLFMVVDSLREKDTEIEKVVHETVSFYRTAITDHIALEDAAFGGTGMWIGLAALLIVMIIGKPRRSVKR